MNRITVTCKAFTKAVTEDPTTGDRFVEQIVSVFGNVDLGKDRVNAGAFSNTLAKWGASTNPLPVYFSHQWDNPYACIGEAVEMKELLSGDPLIADIPEIADLGGLWVKYKVDGAERAFADQVFHLLKERRVVQASFAYDV